MTGLLGRCVKSSLLPDLEGVVVHQSAAAGLWRRGPVSFDIVWSDQTATRGVSAESLMAPAGTWQLQSKWVSPSECNRLWYDYQVARTKEMARQAALRKEETVVVPHGSDPLPRSNARSASLTDVVLHTLTAPDCKRSQAREVARQVRESLQARFPGTAFSVSCARQHLDLGWVDGPVPGGVLHLVLPWKDQGRVRDVRATRVLSDQLVSAAIQYCLRKVMVGPVDALSHAQWQAHQIRLTSADYLAGNLDGLLPPAQSACPSIPYRSLIRCVLERWDGERGRFVLSSVTRSMRQEQAILFRQGDEAASREFAGILRDLAEASGEAREALRSYSERMRG